MSFRAKFLSLFSVAVLAGTGLLAWGAIRQTRQTYGRFDGQRDATLTAQFQRELTQRGEEVSYAMQGLADAEATLRMVLDLGRPNADPSVYANDARGLATAHQLDFLDLVSGDGTLISSAQWPARSGYKNDWVSSGQDWNHHPAFIQRVDLPDGVELGLLAVRTVSVGEKNLYLIGGLRLDREMLRALAVPAGTRALLYSNLDSDFVPEGLTSADGQIDQPERFAQLVAAAENSPSPSQQSIQWTADRASTENFVTIPLTGRQNEALGVVLLGSTQRDLLALENSIGMAALVVAAVGLLAGMLLSGWAAARVSKPIMQVTTGVRQVTAGNWSAQVDLRSREEAGQLAQAFNEMTAHISRERARLVQTERVAAWRDVAQRMTQEVKQYLFPIEVTVSALTRARAESSPRFGEVLSESLIALRNELDQLKAAVNRFSEFAKMPQPRCKPVDVNEILRGVLQAFEPQFRALGRPPITPELALDSKIGSILADPDQLRRALENLLLHSIDTMPAGGTLTVRTGESNKTVRIQISGSGAGFGTEQRTDPFTAFRARQTPGAAMGLPTTQAVVSDHGGRFFAETVPGVGTTFHLEFAVTTEVAAPPAMHLEPPRRMIKHELPEITEAVLESIPVATVASRQPPEVPAPTPSPMPLSASAPAPVAAPVVPPAFAVPAVPPSPSSAPLPPPDIAPPVAPAADPPVVPPAAPAAPAPAPVVASPVASGSEVSVLPPAPLTVVAESPALGSVSDLPLPFAATLSVSTAAESKKESPEPLAPAALSTLETKGSHEVSALAPPPTIETKTESPEAPEHASIPALETMSELLEAPAQPPVPEPAPSALPPREEVPAKPAPRRRSRGLLPSLLGLDLLPREDMSDSPETADDALQTVPPESTPPPAAGPADQSSLKQD